MTGGLAYFRRNNAVIARVFALLCGSGGTAALAFVTQSVLAHGMPIAQYGQLAALLAMVNLMTPVAGCSMGWFWLQLFGEEGRAAQRWIGPTIRISLLLSVLSVGAIT